MSAARDDGPTDRLNVTDAEPRPSPGGQPRESLSRGTDDELPHGHYKLLLYIAGQTSKSLAAIANLKRLCDQHLVGCHEVEVVDLSKDPGRAAADQIVALPTLVRRLPEPLKRIIGDLANAEKVLLGLEIKRTRP